MIFPGKKLGVFGSGQLGRMFTQSAAKMGYKVVVYSPESNSPASKAGALEYVGDYQDKEKVFGFLDSVEAITFEFENIPEKTLTFIKEYVKTRRPIVSRPSPECIEISQNRLKEKNFFQKIGLKTVNFYPIQNKEEVLELLESYSYPSILKTNRFGYDGKGQQKVNSPEELEKIIGEIKELDHILEEKLEFEKELSIIISRFNSGKIISYLPSENIHKDHILDLTIHPVWIDEEILKKARSYG
ncbi:MAG: ATP-grasp domain-containing protein, partial [Leptospiraceae bacterium]|nr:ATP-grasp domain-containing protein [Leptospiraceae bacterium]